MTRVLMLEDNYDLREEVCAYLATLGMEVLPVDCIAAFRQAFAQQGCDIALVDRMLPDGDGMEVVRALRGQACDCGLVVFTARDAPEERIDGYHAGADHYLSKPVRLDELGAVMLSLARRLQGGADWRLDTTAWTLLPPAGGTLQLTGQQAVFLATLARARGQLVSRRELVEALGKSFSSYDPRNLDALMMRLRQRVEALGPHPLPVKTRHGAGFQLTAPLRLLGPG